MKSILAVLFAGAICCAFARPAPASDAGTYRERVLYSFCSQKNCVDGKEPWGSLIAVKGKLYGTTFMGGGSNQECEYPTCGTVFSVDRKTGAEQVLYAFCPETGCIDGANPQAGLISVNGMLYGTTVAGGTGCNGVNGNNCGTVFSLDPDTGAETVLYDFAGNINTGATPAASLIDVNGTLYGTTIYGGDAGRGTVFAIDQQTGLETVLYSFCSQLNCADGEYALSNLVYADGKLYGTTWLGGGTGCYENTGCGTVFSVDPTTGAEQVLYSFCTRQNCADGAVPYAGLVARRGVLYGTTSAGGGFGTSICSLGGCGTVFSLDLSTGIEKVLYSFCHKPDCRDGANPFSGLVDVNGILYGTTGDGGTGGGIVFALDEPYIGERVVYNFCSQQNCADGKDPNTLVNVNGELYGTTNSGGAYCQSNGGCGTVFVLRKTR